MKSKYLQALACSLLFTMGFSYLCFSNELSLNGIVPVVSDADGRGWTMGIPVSGQLSGNHFDLYAGYWDPASTEPIGPRIAADALIFPSKNAILRTPFSTNISWHVDKITDDIDGTNVTISQISVFRADYTNDVIIITNDIQNIIGTANWLGFLGNATNYVVKFEVVDSLSITNSRTFWDNTFTVVPEPTGLFWLFGFIFMILKLRP